MDTRECNTSEDRVLETPLLSDREESKKKKRRVSFADELTSVHVFQRDDSGSDQTPPAPDNPKSEEEEDENDDAEQRNFVLDFPSPASEFGSASTASNYADDGERWFGQVSASFIRGPQLSASAASDDNNNYEATLDSTEFKLNLQNHNQSDSEENFKTPTRSHLSLEWRTPSTRDLTGINSTGNLVRGVDKPTPAASISGGKSSGGDMSLLDENTRIYDYGMLSHTLEAKLGEYRSLFDGIFVTDLAKIPKSSNFEGVSSELNTYDELKSQQMGLKDMGGNRLEIPYPQDPPSEVVSDVNHKGHDGFAASIIDWSITGTEQSLPDDVAVQAHQSRNLSESTAPMNIPSAMDQDSAKAALLVVGGLTVEFGGVSDQPFEFGDGSESSDQPLSPPREKNLIHIMTQSDRRDADNVEHKMAEGSLSTASCTPDIGFKTNQSSTPEGSTSLLCDKQRPIFHPSIEFSLSESPRLHVEGRMDGDSLNDTRCTPESGFKTNQSSKSPIKGSIASLSAKRQKMFHSTSSAGQQPSSLLNNGSMNSLTISSMDCSSQQVKIVRALEVDNNLVKTTEDDSSTDNKIHANVTLAGPGEVLVSGFQENKKVEATAGMSMDAEGSSPLRTPRIIRNSRENEDIVHNGVLKDRIFTGISFSGHGRQMDLVTTKVYVTPSQILSPLNSQWGSTESRFFSRTDPARLTERVSEKNSSCGPAFSCVRKRTATPTKLEK
ncbi:hypothetical protein MKW94_019944, partial [Papaver nudicaule]|nr:hypothetical protein [Papaver nudicaule]